MITLKAYEERTEEFRDSSSSCPKDSLFLSWIGNHNPVTSSTIARWLRTCMSEAGVDVSIFKAHSVRGPTCRSRCDNKAYSGYSRLVISTTEIQGMMTKQPSEHQFCHLQTIHVNMKWSLPICNLRMAQGIKCLHAIWNCMKKV